MKTLPADSRRGFLGLLAKLPLIPAAVLPTRGASAPKHRVLMNDFAIAGFRYYDGAKDLPRLTAGTTLTLRAEPENPHDRFAVQIFHGPAKLGYVPRFCNRHICRLLLEGVPLACEVERVDAKAPPWEAVSVRLSLICADSMNSVTHGACRLHEAGNISLAIST